MGLATPEDAGGEGRLQIRQIEAFRAVMTLGSMTKAAEVLKVSQPAISRLVMSLSESVGFPLFRRHGSGSIPTAEAQQLFAEVEKVFHGLDALGRSARAIRQAEGGSLRVAAMGHYANGLVPQLVAAFLAANPGVTVSLEAYPRQVLAEQLLARRCELGITSLPVASPELAVRKLVAQPVLCALPAGHVLAARPVIDVRDLAGLPFISFSQGTPFRYEVDAVFERAAVARRQVAETTTPEGVCALVAAGAGVSLVSPFSPHLAHLPGLVLRAFTPAVVIEVGLVAVEAHLSTLGRRFIDFATRFQDPRA